MLYPSRHPKRRNPRRRPGVERLEDRVCLSTLSAGSDSLFIGDAKDNAVKAFDAGTGSFQGTFVSSGSGGLHGPVGVIFDHSGNLLVSNQDVNLPINGDVLRYDGTTGAFDNQVISPSDPHAPFAPRSVVLGPDDTLYVADLLAPDNVSDGKIEEYRDFSLNTTDLGPCVVDCCPDGARQTSLGQRPRKGEGVIRLLIEP